MTTYESIYDISVRLGDESIDYPGDAPYSRELIWTIKDSGLCDLSKIVMSAHSGTHIDTPAHFIEGGRTLDSYAAQDFILPAQVVNIEDKEVVRAVELKNLTIEPGEALLFRTANSVRGLCRTGGFSEKFVYLSPEAAELCVEKDVSLIGIDYITIERYGDTSFPSHRTVLGNNILILEGINLNAVPSGRYTLCCFPLNIQGGEASPVRAVLMR